MCMHAFHNVNLMAAAVFLALCLGACDSLSDRL